jgi:hypothetical protein
MSYWQRVRRFFTPQSPTALDRIVDVELLFATDSECLDETMVFRPLDARPGQQ